MQQKMTTASVHTKAQQVKAYLQRLIAHYEAQMDPDLPMGINLPPGVELDGISLYDGTAGCDGRPDFVRADDES